VLDDQVWTAIRQGFAEAARSPLPAWHLDEMVCNVGGRQMYLWRAVDDEGEVLDLVMQRQRNTQAVLKLLKRLLRNQPVTPTAIVTDCLKSYGAALVKLGLSHIYQNGKKRENNRAENSHLPIRRRERQQQGSKYQASAQRFLTSHAAIYNTFYTARHLTKRSTLRIFRGSFRHLVTGYLRLDSRTSGDHLTLASLPDRPGQFGEDQRTP
jgi:putative transposase